LIITSAKAVIAPAIATLTSAAAGPRRAAWISVKGGSSIDRSTKKSASGWRVPLAASGWRAGSRSEATHSASSTPGTPTARKAACQPVNPPIPPPG